MSHALVFVIIGLAVAAVGGLIFWGGTKLMERQKNRAGGIGSCLVALVGAVIIFFGVGILLASMVVQ